MQDLVHLLHERVNFIAAARELNWYQSGHGEHLCQ